MEDQPSTVVRMDAPQKRQGRRAPDERWLWRQAVQIVALLPEVEAEAHAVLCYAHDLLIGAPKG